MSTRNWPAIGSGSPGGGPPAPPTEHEHWWRFARSVAERLRHGQLPPPIQVFGPVLWPGEQAYFQAEVTYARMYGGDGRYYTHSLMALGSWKFMAGAYAINGYLNQSLVLGFDGSTAPLMLSGGAIPAASVLVSAAVAPDNWDNDPRVGPLLRP